MRRVLQAFILVCFFGATVGSLMLANAIERSVPEWRSFIAVITGLAFGCSLFIFIARVQRAFSIDSPFHVLSGKAFYGLLYGIMAITVSISFVLWNSEWSVENRSMSDAVNQFLFQIRPAIIEEVGFRYGIVVFAFAFFGWVAALIAGAIPFGVLHLLNFISGEPIYWEYILGTTIAGLFLTLVFLRHGLGAAILTHYVWNVCASIIAGLLAIPQERIEGGLGTFAVLLGLSLWLGLRREQAKMFQ